MTQKKIIQISLNDHLSYSSEDIETNFICLRLPDSVSTWSLVAASGALVLRNKKQIALYPETQVRGYTLSTLSATSPPPIALAYTPSSSFHLPEQSSQQTFALSQNIEQHQESQDQTYSVVPTQQKMSKLSMSQFTSVTTIPSSQISDSPATNSPQQVKGSVCITYITPESSSQLTSSISDEDKKEEENIISENKIFKRYGIDNSNQELRVKKSSTDASNTDEIGRQVSESCKKNNHVTVDSSIPHEKISKSQDSPDVFLISQSLRESSSQSSQPESPSISNTFSKVPMYYSAVDMKDTLINEGIMKSSSDDIGISTLMKGTADRILIPETINEEIQTSVGEVDKIEQEYKKLQEEIQQKMEAITKKNKEIETLTNTISDFSSQIILKKDYKKLCSDITKEVNIINEDITQLKNTLSLNEIKHKQITESQLEKINNIKEEITKVTIKNESLTKELLEVQKKDFGMIDEALIDNNRKKEEFEKEIENLKEMISKYNQQILQLQLEHDKKIQDSNLFEKEIQSIHDNISEINSKIKTESFTINNMREDMFEEEIFRAKKIKTLEENKEMHEKENFQIKHELASLMSHYNELSKKTKEERERLDMLKKRLDIYNGCDELEIIIRQWKKLEKTIVEVGANVSSEKSLLIEQRHNISVLLTKVSVLLKTRQYV